MAAALRFGVGARVECNVGAFLPGEVVALNYREPDWPPGKTAPYQVKLADGRLIYAPFDDDRLIRRPRTYPLVEAARAGLGDLANALEKIKANPDAFSESEQVGLDAPDDKGDSPLGVVSARGDYAAAFLLLEAGASPSAKDGRGRIPLHHAVESGSMALVTALLDSGSPLDEKDYVPDMLASFSASGVDLPGNDTPLTLAIKCEEDDIAMTLVERGAMIDVLDAYNCTPLAIALEEKNYDLAAVLLARGADQVLGKNLLRTYSSKGNAHVVNMLLKSPRGDAPVNGKESSTGMTPLHLAARRDASDVVRLLLAAGADPSLTNKSGQTPLTLAEANGKAEAVETLRAAAAPPGSSTAMVM